MLKLNFQTLQLVLKYFWKGRRSHMMHGNKNIKIIKRQYPRTTETWICIYPNANLSLYTEPINIQNTFPEAGHKTIRFTCIQTSLWNRSLPASADRPASVQLFNCLAASVQLFNYLTASVQLFNCLTTSVRLFTAREQPNWTVCQRITNVAFLSDLLCQHAMIRLANWRGYWRGLLLSCCLVYRPILRKPMNL